MLSQWAQSEDTIDHYYNTLLSHNHIVKVYNTFMGGVDKLDMMCSLYKPTLKSRRWYIYIWLHTVVIALVNAWFLYRCNLAIVNPQAKPMPLKTFHAEVASILISSGKSLQGRQFLGAMVTPPQRKVPKVQGNPTLDMRRDGMDHLSQWNEKRQRCLNCKTGFSYLSCKKCNVWLCINKETVLLHTIYKPWK